MSSSYGRSRDKWVCPTLDTVDRGSFTPAKHFEKLAEQECERLARALFLTDPDVVKFVWLKGEEEVQFHVGYRDAHVSNNSKRRNRFLGDRMKKVADVAWDRNENGWRGRAEGRARAVLECIRDSARGRAARPGCRRPNELHQRGESQSRKVGVTDAKTRKQERLELAERERKEAKILEIAKRVTTYMAAYKCPVVQTVNGHRVTFSMDEGHLKIVEKIREAMMRTE